MPIPLTDEPPAPRAWAGAFLAWGQAPRFLRNAAISLPTFLLDLGLLYVLVQRVHLNYLVATVIGFFVANGLGYFLARWLVFAGTRRGVSAGLVYFLGIAALSALVLTLLMWVAVHLLHIDVILSRIVVACVVGVGGYLLNLVFNFRLGRRQRPPPG